MNTLKLVKDRIDHERRGRNFHYKDDQISIIGHRMSGVCERVDAAGKKKDLDKALAGNRGF